MSVADIRQSPGATAAAPPPESVPVVHVVQGQLLRGADVVHASGRFTTPALDADALVWPRSVPGPAFDVPVAEIVDLLVATGARLRADPDGVLAEALDRLVPISTLPRAVLENAYAALWRSFERERVQAQVDLELGGADVLDGWREVVLPGGRVAGCGPSRRGSCTSWPGTPRASPPPRWCAARSPRVSTC